MKIKNAILNNGIIQPIKFVGAFILSRLNVHTWAKLHTGQEIHVDLSSTVGRSIFLRKKYETIVEECIKKHLSVGDVFIDVGANVGYFTLTSSELVGQGGEVHSFEPHPEIYKLLSDSVSRNKIPNISINNFALSGKSEVLSYHSLKNSAFSWSQPKNKLNNNENTIDISAIALDQYVEEKPCKRISLIKIDVEGAECEVLFGAKKTLASMTPSIIVEAQDWSLSRFNHSIDDMFNYLQPLGYSAYSLDGVLLENVEQARDVLINSKIQNLLFKTKKEIKGN